MYYMLILFIIYHNLLHISIYLIGNNIKHIQINNII